MTWNTYLGPFPDIGQLTGLTDDGQPSENAPNDCGPDSLAQINCYLTGNLWYPDTIKDSPLYLGQGKVGYSNEYEMQAYSRQRLGTDCTIYYPQYGDTGTAANIIRSYIRDGRPVAILRYATSTDRANNGPGSHWNVVRGASGPDDNHTDTYVTRDPYGITAFDRTEDKATFFGWLRPYNVTWNNAVPWSTAYLIVGFERRRAVDATTPLFTPQG
jgi:hypothetical protein